MDENAVRFCNWAPNIGDVAQLVERPGGQVRRYFENIRLHQHNFESKLYMTEVEKASARMFGPGSLQVRNIGFTLGTNRDLTAEDIAKELNRVLDQIERGEYEEV